MDDEIATIEEDEEEEIAIMEEDIQYVEGTSDYEELENKPQINGIELIGNKSLNDLGIATELSELSQDELHRTVTDEEKQTWNNKANTSDIPTELSQLNGDTTHRLVTDTEKESWNGKAEISDIPTNVSELNNDSNYQNNTEVASAIAVETTNRENADLGLQNQIDAITNANDVVDVLATYQALLDYDTQHLKNNDIIKVMQDSTHDGAISYFKWVIVDNVGSWSYVGSQGPFYTKNESDQRFVPQTRTINGKALSSDITLNNTDVGSYSTSETFNKNEINGFLNSKQNLIDNEHKLNSSLIDDSNSANKFVTSTEKSQITINQNNITNLQNTIGTINTALDLINGIEV